MKIAYIGSGAPLEKQLLPADLDYWSVPSGKFRRYFSWLNFIDPFKLLIGICKSWYLLAKLKPKLIFSKGGYVALPVIIAGALRRIPIIAHESDASLGLVSRISAFFAKEFWCSYNSAKIEAEKRYPHLITKIVPVLVRKEILTGSKESALNICGFKNDKPVVLVMGGSLGAESINNLIDKSKDEMLRKFNIIHICGKGKLRKGEIGQYFTLEYADTELPHFYALADLIIGRSGANSLAEWRQLGVPVILCPLGGTQSRGEQKLNAQAYLQDSPGIICDENNITSKDFISLCTKLLANNTKAAKTRVDVFDDYTKNFSPYF